MVLNQLKKVREELKKSSEVYDNAFKSTALIAAKELNKHNNIIHKNLDNQDIQSNRLNSTYTKEYFVKKFGTLKNAKLAYNKIYGQQMYGRSWSDFIAVAKKLSNSQPRELSLEERITKIEQFLRSLGYQP